MTDMKFTAYNFTLIAILVFATAVSLSAQKERVLYRFTGIHLDGIQPQATLIADAEGNLYGTTTYGGNIRACENTNHQFFGCGMVFELSPLGIPGGAWTETHLHIFSGNAGGAAPSSGLVLDQKGNLYGVTAYGGSAQVGTAYELSPPAAPGGHWTATLLYNFCTVSGSACGPSGPLAIDQAGNLYGVSGGGSEGCGTAFELSPSGGIWTLSVLYNFKVGGGCTPANGVIFDESGNLYGTTVDPYNYDSTVFRLSPSSGGSWTKTTLHIFRGGRDGGMPAGGLLISKGALYGVTSNGGSGGGGCGTVYQLLPSGKYTIIHRFAGASTDGCFPEGGLIADKAGNLYGTTEQGGGYPRCGLYGCGAVFKLTPPSGTRIGWTETTLYGFSGFDGDGLAPWGGLVFGKEGALYGTTLDGGDAYCSLGGNPGCGTVFAVPH
jgi:uncharacterized repeat protein (TIGR03803 family)